MFSCNWKQSRGIFYRAAIVPFLLTSIAWRSSPPLLLSHAFSSARSCSNNISPSCKSLSSTPEMTASPACNSHISYVDALVAKEIDDRLMSRPGYTLDQLMELAGYSVACAAHDLILQRQSTLHSKTILIYCGPGNNGGDGLVAARHLKHFGFHPVVVYPKPSSGQIFANLVAQLQGLDIDVLNASQLPSQEKVAEAALVIDGLFGFSFKGPSREPFASIIQQFRSLQEIEMWRIPVLSIDIPSGWDVDEGDIHGTGFLPEAVISLTLPKRCMRDFQGTHYVGGRFMPPRLARELGLTVPDYGSSVSQVGQLSA